MSQPILLPLLAMLALTMLVWIVMFVTRGYYISAAKINVQDFARPEPLNAVLPDYAIKPSNNFKNLFEVPVVFYVMVLYLAVSGTADDTHLLCAWIFVGFRALHSLIHCTINNVNLRGMVYAVSCIALIVMVVRGLLQAL